MLRREDAFRLRHMLDASREAIGFAAGKTRGDLGSDRQLTLSLVRCLEIIGEAAAQVSGECRDACRQVAWADMIAMRNRLIHAYFDVNLSIVWRTVRDDLPCLVAALNEILSEEEA